MARLAEPHRAGGRRVHGVANLNANDGVSFQRALCGVKPNRAYHLGWSAQPAKAITCPKCLLRASSEGLESEAASVLEAKRENVALEAPDRLLRELVALDVDQHLGLEITLQVGGLLLSGTLIDARTYFANSGIRGVLERRLDAGDPEAARDQITKWASDFYSDDRERSLSYVHLKNARFFSPGCFEPMPRASGRWWRGRLSEVSGFMLGGLGS
jgi:hypothetical protein